jgi:hypothetical protein
MGSMPSSCVVDRVYRVGSDEDGWDPSSSELTRYTRSTTHEEGMLPITPPILIRTDPIHMIYHTRGGHATHYTTHPHQN